MKAPRLLAMGAAAAAMLIASGAEAQQRSVGGGVRSPPPSQHGGMHGKQRIFVPVFFVEQQAPVVIQREVVREVPVAAEPPKPAPPAPPPREPYAIGKSYATLPPSGCMKMIEGGASYYLCGGEWYQQVSSDGAVAYKAVAKR